jgi:hypothetical protein
VQKPVRRAECAALKPVPAAPNDARVSGAGPMRKTFIAPKACKAPHPLQPIVRPQRLVYRRVVVSTRADPFELPLVHLGSGRRIPQYLQTPAGSAWLHDHAPVRLLAAHNAPKPAPLH